MLLEYCGAQQAQPLEELLLFYGAAYWDARRLESMREGHCQFAARAAEASQGVPKGAAGADGAMPVGCNWLRLCWLLRLPAACAMPPLLVLLRCTTLPLASRRRNPPAPPFAGRSLPHCWLRWRRRGHSWPTSLTA